MFVCMLALSCVTSAATSNLKQQGVAIRLHEQQMAEAEKETMRANLLRAVSHDLRTPLTSILGSISAMESCGGSYSQEEYQELIHNIYDDANSAPARGPPRRKPRRRPSTPPRAI